MKKNILSTVVYLVTALPLGGVGGGLFLSCSDMLDKEPYGQFTADLLSEDDLDGTIAGAYAGLEAHFFGNNEAFDGPSTNWVLDVRSDDALKGGGQVSMEVDIHQLEIEDIKDNNACALNKWRNSFYAISRCNKAIETVSETGIAETRKAALLGEVRLLRAFYYFDAIRCFERIPYFIEGEDLSSKSNTEFTRDEILSKIKDDLTYAYENMPETAASEGRFNRYGAAALMARVCCYTSDWADVERYADIVIKSGKYSVYENYGDMSKIEFNNQKESILALQVTTENDNLHGNWSNLLNCTFSDDGNGNSLYGGGDDFFLASQNLVNAFATNDDGLPYLDGNGPQVTLTSTVDPRLDMTVGRIGGKWRGHDYTDKWCRAYDIYGEYSGKKWYIDPSDPATVIGRLPWGCSNLNFIFLRYSDVLLMKAEALIEQGRDLDTARQLINEVRQKAVRTMNQAGSYTPVDLNAQADYYVATYPATGWNQDYARRALRMERRLEFAMEGQRWFDLCRWGVVTDVMNRYFQTESRIHTYLAGATMSNSAMFYPTPLEEITNSNGLYK